MKEQFFNNTAYLCRQRNARNPKFEVKLIVYTYLNNKEIRRYALLLKKSVIQANIFSAHRIRCMCDIVSVEHLIEV